MLNNNYWPKVDKSTLENEKVNIVLQINGKKREIYSVKKNITENELLNIINNDKKINHFFMNKKIIQKIFVPNRIINIIIK